MRTTEVCKVLRRHRKSLLLLCVGCLLLYYHRHRCSYPTFPGCHHEFFRPRSTPQFSLDYAYIHDARDLCGKATGSSLDQHSAFGGPDIVILVLTMSRNVEERRAVRDTYGSVSRGGAWPSPGKSSDEEGSGGSPLGSVRVVFLMGQTKDVDFKQEEVEIVRKESGEYGDVVQWDGMVEDYFNLTLKVLLGLRWVRHYCPHAKYVVKADDSTFIHLPRLFQHIERSPEMTDELVSFDPDFVQHVYRIHGGLHAPSKASRSGKFAVSGSAYPLCEYPSYVDGPFYFMHVSLAMRILSVGNYLPYLNIEDAYVTGVSACVVRARHFDLRVSEYYLCQTGRRCDFLDHGSLIAARDTPPGTFREIWRTLSDPDLCSSFYIFYLRTFDFLLQSVCNIKVYYS